MVCRYESLIDRRAIFGMKISANFCCKKIGLKF